MSILLLHALAYWFCSVKHHSYPSLPLLIMAAKSAVSHVVSICKSVGCVSLKVEDKIR